MYRYSLVKIQSCIPLAYSLLLSLLDFYETFEVVRQTAGGSYVLKELDGTISKRGVAAFRLLPYHSRDGKPILPDKLPLDDSSGTSDDDFDEVD